MDFAFRESRREGRDKPADSKSRSAGILAKHRRRASTAYRSAYPRCPRAAPAPSMGRSKSCERDGSVKPLASDTEPPAADLPQGFFTIASRAVSLIIAPPRRRCGTAPLDEIDLRRLVELDAAAPRRRRDPRRLARHELLLLQFGVGYALGFPDAPAPGGHRNGIGRTRAHPTVVDRHGAPASYRRAALATKKIFRKYEGLARGAYHRKSLPC